MDLTRRVLLKVNQDRGDRRVQTVCLLILTVIAVGVALFLLRPVLVPFVLALFFTYCLTPLIDLQVRRFRVPRGVAIVGAGIIGLGFLFLIGLLVATSIGQMAQSSPQYQERLKQLYERTIQWVPLDRYGLVTSSEGKLRLPDDAAWAFTFVQGVLAEMTGFVSKAALVMIFMIFILLSPHEYRPRKAGLLAEVELRVKRYLSQMVSFSVITGLAVGVVLGILGVPFAAVFGFLAFLLNFIPTVGAIIATLLPLPIVMLSPELSVPVKVLALAIPGGIQFVLGVLQPKVMGSSLELHPVPVLMALIFFGMIWGLVGAFLATPITAVIKIVLERIPVARPLARLMAGDLDVLADTPQSDVAVEVEDTHPELATVGAPEGL